MSHMPLQEALANADSAVSDLVMSLMSEGVASLGERMFPVLRQATELIYEIRTIRTGQTHDD